MESTSLLRSLISTLPDGRIIQVNIGFHWTAVVIEVNGEERCGLASTLIDVRKPHGEADVPQAGQLEELSGLELAALAQSEYLALTSVGIAAINALLPPKPEAWKDLNAEEVIAEHGDGELVALVGHFPFVSRLRTRVGKLVVLEQNPQSGDLPANMAADIIPKAKVVAITGTTLINRTLEDLLALSSPHAQVILLGPSTPLSPILFDFGIDLLCGSLVTDIKSVLETVRQAGNFRQVHKAGVRLVSMARPARTK